ncbi:MAG: hypothetical protein Q7R88_02815 [bacterium]|nr:hypothetical protein [bacterium]
MEPQAKGGTGKMVTVLVIGLIIGFAGGAFWQSYRGGSLAEEEVAQVVTEEADGKSTVVLSTDTAAAAGDPLLSGKTVAAMDQGAGTSVSVERVVSDETVWVAVREQTDGGLGNILGVQKVTAGEQKGVKVQLLRGTEAGGTYAIVLYRDMGTPAFNYREDVLVEGVMDSFTVEDSGAPVLEFEIQTQ